MDIETLQTEISAAIAAEKRAVVERLGVLGIVDTVELEDGRRILAEPGAYRYRFHCALPVQLPEGSTGQIEAPGYRASIEVWEHDPDEQLLTLVSQQDIGAEQAVAGLRFDATFLLDLLQKRIDRIAAEHIARRQARAPAAAGDNVELAFRFLEGLARAAPPVPLERRGVSPAQARAIAFALGQQVAYIWGPPGTGKTRTIAHLVHEYIQRGKRVILCAHTNVATDNALLRVREAAACGPQDLLRVGYCSEAVLRAELGMDAVVDRKLRAELPDAVTAVEDICRGVARLLDAPPGLLHSSSVPLGRRFEVARALYAHRAREADDRLSRRIGEVAGLMAQVQAEAIARARVVATTLTKLYTSGQLATHSADVVIIDETSIASLPLSFIAGCKATAAVVAVGDFMQLPAIVQSGERVARQWLGRHVFNSAGADDAGREHPLRVMLDEQWRMHPRISRVVSQLFYADRLRDAPAVTARARPGPAIALLDSCNTPAASRRTAAGSKANDVHAERVAELVLRAGQRPVAVIAPYRAQVRLIREAVRRRSPQALRSGRVEVFTTHRFQGRDKELVIFDLTEAPGTGCRFLDDLREPQAGMLINVALSRAREQLCLLAHTEHITASMGSNSLLSRLFAAVRLAGGLELDARDEKDLDVLERFLQAEADGDPAH